MKNELDAEFNKAIWAFTVAKAKQLGPKSGNTIADDLLKEVEDFFIELSEISNESQTIDHWKAIAKEVYYLRNKIK